MAEEESIPTIYSNSVRLLSSAYDFSIVFGLSEPPLSPPAEGGEVESANIKIYNRVLMSPQHFKKFLEIANISMEQYEQRHGKVIVGE